MKALSAAAAATAAAATTTDKFEITTVTTAAGGWGSHPRFAGDRGSTPTPTPDFSGGGGPPAARLQTLCQTTVEATKHRPPPEIRRRGALPTAEEGT